MIVRAKKKKTAVSEQKERYIFTVKLRATGEVVGEFYSIPAIPISYCNESKYKITYRKEAV